MSINLRARGLVLGAICLGGGLLGSVTAFAPSAGASTSLQCAAQVAGSGSSLQKVAQLEVFTKPEKFSSTLCSSKPAVTYTSTSSGPGLAEFGNETEQLEPTQSLAGNTGTTLDGYVGSDDPPQAYQLTNASKAGGGNGQAELTVPVAEAPVAMLIHPPAGCTVTSAPDVPNKVLDKLWLGEEPTWTAFLQAAGISFHEAAAGNCATPITLYVRLDNSGTSFVFKSYLSQIDGPKWHNYATDGTIWPVAGAVTSAIEKGGGGEAKSVKESAGSIGYAAAADAHGKEFGPWVSEATPLFWAKVQNNGTGETGVKYADPANAANGNCPSVVTTGGIPLAGDSWYGVLASDPKINGDGGNEADYSLCGLTYDLVWKDYAKIGSLGNAAEYGGNATSAQEVGNATADFLTYVTGPGQTVLATAGQYYSPLPAIVQTLAQETVDLIAGTGLGVSNLLATFTETTPSPQPGHAVTFDASSSTVPTGGSIASYEWSFGDGSQPASVSTPTIAHTFATAGVYSVTLTITDAHGATAHKTESIQIGTLSGGGQQSGGAQQTTTTQIITTHTSPAAVVASIGSGVQGTHVGVQVSCAVGGPACAGTITIKTAGAITASAAQKGKRAKKIAAFTVASKSYTLASGQSQTIQVSLSAKAAALLRQKGSLSVIATVTVTGGQTTTKHLVLRAKKSAAHKKAKKH